MQSIRLLISYLLVLSKELGEYLKIGRLKNRSLYQLELFLSFLTLYKELIVNKQEQMLTYGAWILLFFVSFNLSGVKMRVWWSTKSLELGKWRSYNSHNFGSLEQIKWPVWTNVNLPFFYSWQMSLKSCLVLIFIFPTTAIISNPYTWRNNISEEIFRSSFCPNLSPTH